MAVAHQFIRRDGGGVMTEELFGDAIVRFLYSTARERAPRLFSALTGGRASHLLGLANFDLPFTPALLGNRRFLERNGVDLNECLEPPETFTTPRRIFERKIRYWECRPEPVDPRAAVSPADSRAIVGSLDESSGISVKGKFFDLDELFGGRDGWASAFTGGDFAVFRLTPDKYHYNHAPVSGRLVDCFAVPGAYHSCNPGAVVELVTPYSKNKRFATIFDTNVAGGSGLGLVAMVEVVALMIGDLARRYSEERYDAPRPLESGDFARRGRPMSLFRPGSSTDVLLFQRGRVRFAEDLLSNRNARADSRFTAAFGAPLVETDLAVRSLVALPARGDR